MQTYYDAKEMLHKELDEIVRKGDLSVGSLETIDKLLNSIKNACKIIMYDEYSDDEGYSNASGGNMGGGNYSNARGGRGRGSNARRDSMGRYSREGGGSSYARGGSRGGGRGGYSREGGYSYDDGEEKMEILQEMMNEARSEDERRVIQKVMRRMEE